MIKHILTFCLIALVACGPNARQKQLQGAMIALRASTTVIAVYSKEHQHQITSTATSEADGIVKLTAFKEKRDRVVAAFSAAFEAVAAAALLDDKPASLASALAAAALAQQAWNDLRKAAP